MKLVVKRSSIHGRGLFAEEAIPEGAVLGEYQGRETTWRPRMYVGNYCFRVGDIMRDSRYGGNDLRFVNHSKQHNVRADGFTFVALRDIEIGEEILLDYGHGWT